MSARRYDNLSDEQLAVLAQRGDRRAMDLLVTRYEPLRAKVLYQFGLELDEDLRHDLANEIAIGVVELIGAYDPSKRVGVAGWLKVTLGRKARDARNRLIGHDDLPLEDDRDGKSDAATPGASRLDDPPDAHARYAELMDALEERLDPLKFRIFQLWFWECSYKEIADLLGMRVDQVRNTMSREKPPGVLQIAREVLREHGYA